MKKLLVIMIMSLGLIGCVSVEGDKITNTSVDNSVSKTLLECTDSECAAAPEGTDPAEADAIVGEYDADYNRIECNAAGFFYCTIDNICVDSPLESGTCPVH